MSGPYRVTKRRVDQWQTKWWVVGPAGDVRGFKRDDERGASGFCRELNAAYAAGRAELEQMRKALLDTTLALDKLPSGRRYAGTLMQAKDALRCIPLEELVALKSRECASELQEHCELVPSDCRCERAIRALLAPQADKDQQT